MKQLFALGIMMLFFAGCREEKADVVQESSVQKEKILGISKECEEFMPQNSGRYTAEEWEILNTNFTACCEKYNACWSLAYKEDENKNDTVRLMIFAERGDKNILLSWLCLTADSVQHRDFCAKNPNPIKLEMRIKIDSICGNAINKNDQFTKICDYLKKSKFSEGK